MKEQGVPRLLALGNAGDVQTLYIQGRVTGVEAFCIVTYADSDSGVGRGN